MSNVNSIHRQVPTAGPYLSRADAAKRAGVSVRTLERLFLDGGGPPAARIGRRVTYPLERLDAWLEERLVTSTSDRGAA